MTDIELAQGAALQPIHNIAQKLAIPSDFYAPYGHYKAKIELSLIDHLSDHDDGKLILVTAITPTKAGEGKSTVTIGLTDGLNALNLRAIAALRQPSLGPIFGIKGAATGGGHSQVIPMDEINLHFTGDIHAVSAAHNLISALIDNHLYQGNSLNINPKRVVWKRVIDMNDRSLRSVVVGLGDALGGVMRHDSFQITVASEIMATLCLVTSYDELKESLGAICLAYRYDGSFVTLAELGAVGGVAALLKEALKPNLVQTMEGNPVLIHGGPFANIAHGCNSLIATKMALKLSDYVITEAGFAADLGAEKFFNIKCRVGNLTPSAVVLVATLQALKLHGGALNYHLPNQKALIKGFENLDKHLENLAKFGLPAVVAINCFSTDTEEEIKLLEQHCSQRGVTYARSTAWAEGGQGAKKLATAVIEACNITSTFRYLYQESLTLKEKMITIATEIYGAEAVNFSPSASKSIAFFEEQGFGHLPVCVAKTQNSLSDNPKLLGKPTNFTVTISHAHLSAGAGFVVMSAGAIIDMPALPKRPLAFDIDIDHQGKISGLS